MPSITSFDGEYYHGTIMDRNKLIDKLNFEMAEFEGIWFTEEEVIAQEFADTRVDSIENGYKVILLVHVKANKIIKMTYEETVDFTEKYELYDFREAIPILKKKYKGWIIPGSIGYNRYEDMCVF